MLSGLANLRASLAMHVELGVWTTCRPVGGVVAPKVVRHVRRREMLQSGRPLARSSRRPSEGLACFCARVYDLNEPNPVAMVERFPNCGGGLALLQGAKDVSRTFYNVYRSKKVCNRTG
jgi:hypothetical protein